MKKIYLYFLCCLVLSGIFYLGWQVGTNNCKNVPANFPNGLRNKEGVGIMNRGGMVNGEVIKKDEQSLVVKTKDGSSKVIYFSSSTEIGKFEKGSIGDILEGSNLMINGSNNNDGSISAQNIQIRPLGQFSPPQPGDQPSDAKP